MKFYYPDAVDIWDPQWPDPMGPWVKGTIFADSNHSGDKVTSKSKTDYGICGV